MPDDVAGDLVLPPSRGLPRGLVVPARELVEHFSRASGPGGQSVNTADSRVELWFDVSASTAVRALRPEQRDRLARALAARLMDGAIRVVAAEHRSQHRNRLAARARLAALLADALRPPSPARRATRPSRAARARRVEAKLQRAQLKSQRRRPDPRSE